MKTEKLNETEMTSPEAILASINEETEDELAAMLANRVAGLTSQMREDENFFAGISAAVHTIKAEKALAHRKDMLKKSYETLKAVKKAVGKDQTAIDEFLAWKAGQDIRKTA